MSQIASLYLFALFVNWCSVSVFGQTISTVSKAVNVSFLLSTMPSRTAVISNITRVSGAPVSNGTSAIVPSTSAMARNTTNISSFLATNLSSNSNTVIAGTLDPSKVFGFGAFDIFPGFSNKLNYQVNGICKLWVDPCTMRSQVRTDVTILDALGKPVFSNAVLPGVAHNQSCALPTFNSYFRRFPQYRSDIPINQMTMALVGPATSNTSLFNYAFAPQNPPASWIIHHPLTQESMFCCTFEYFPYPTCGRPTAACPKGCVAALILFSASSAAIISISLGCFLRNRIGSAQTAPAHTSVVATRPAMSARSPFQIESSCLRTVLRASGSGYQLQVANMHLLAPAESSPIPGPAGAAAPDTPGLGLENSDAGKAELGPGQTEAGPPREGGLAGASERGVSPINLRESELVNRISELERLLQQMPPAADPEKPATTFGV